MSKNKAILIVSLLVGIISAGLAIYKSDDRVNEKTTITVFAAKSLNSVMDELIDMYGQEHGDVEFITNYDSSGTLMVQIEEGAGCDVFFSAAQSQMNTLEEDGYLVPGTRVNVVNNQVCVVTYKGSNTAVTGIDSLGRAESMALAAGSVPVGKYTRAALMKLDVVNESEDAAKISSEEISIALGGLVINECTNVGAVAAAVSEKSNEVGTVYYSDYMGYEDKLDIIELVPYELTGNVIYPVAEVANKEATDKGRQVAIEFIRFLKSDNAKRIFEKYYFDTNVD